MKSINYPWLLGLCLALFVVTACVPSAPNSTETTSPASQPASGGEDNVLRLAVDFLRVLDPVQGGGFMAIEYGVGETLLQLDTNFQPVPWLAQELTALNATQWQLVLRPALTFHDGAPVDADAVKASLERAIAKNATAQLLLDAQEITVMDAQTLRITTNQPNLRMPGVLTDPSTVIVNVAAAFALGEEAFAQKPIMTGPFAIESLTAEQSATLRRYDGYWDGPASVERVVLTALAEADARMLALQAGQVDIALNIRPESVALAQQDPTLAVVTALPVATGFMYINQQKPTWQTHQMRQALAYAVPDRTTLVKAVLRDQGLPGVGPISPAVLACDALQPIPTDLERAKQLLAELGYADSDGDGIVEKEGQPLTMITLTYPQQAPLTPMAQIIQANFQAIGIAMEIRSVEAINDTLAQQDWDTAMYFNNMATTGDPYGPLANFYTENGAANRGHYVNAAVQAQIEILRDTPQMADRRVLACQISQTLLDDVAIVPLVYPFYSYGVSKAVTNFDEAHPFFLYFVNNKLGKQ